MRRFDLKFPASPKLWFIALLSAGDNYSPDILATQCWKLSVSRSFNVTPANLVLPKDTLVVPTLGRLARSVHDSTLDRSFKNGPIPTPPSHPIGVISFAMPPLMKIEPSGQHQVGLLGKAIPIRVREG